MRAPIGVVHCCPRPFYYHFTVCIGLASAGLRNKRSTYDIQKLFDPFLPVGGTWDTGKQIVFVNPGGRVPAFRIRRGSGSVWDTIGVCYSK